MFYGLSVNALKAGALERGSTVVVLPGHAHTWLEGVIWVVGRDFGYVVPRLGYSFHWPRLFWLVSALHLGVWPGSLLMEIGRGGRTDSKKK